MDDVTLLTARAVDPGHEATFQRWAQQVLATAAASPGHLGGGVFRPAADGGPWIIVHRFQDAPALDLWLRSPQRAQLITDHDDHHHTEVARRERTGMEA